MSVATTCMATLELEPIPALVDGMDNKVGKAYAAMPDRLYLVGRDGKIAFRGARGPDPRERPVQRERPSPAAGGPVEPHHDASHGVVGDRTFERA